MNKFFLNVLAFLGAVLSVYFLIYLTKDKIAGYYPIAMSKKAISIQQDLEQGKIVMFGSSELTRRNHRFIPENFFNKELHMPLIAIGSGGQKEFAIMSKIASLENKNTLENARIVIVLSAGWFFGSTKGTVVPNFLKYVDSSMIRRLYFTNNTYENSKIWVSKYIKEHIKEIKSPSFVYKYALNYMEDNKTNFVIPKLFMNMYLANDNKKSRVPYIYDTPDLNYTFLRKEAIRVAPSSSNNPYGIINETFNKRMKKELIAGKFPYTIPSVPIDLSGHIEYNNFLQLVELFSRYKHKPLFIFIDSNPLAYTKNRKTMYPLLENIGNVLKKHSFGFLNMWTYDIATYKKESMVDQSHTGELGWIDVNKKIIEHFIVENH